ncbi:MAG: Hpt domain-containing protein [Clostridia bacterium]|nr:Hpt domain-containing protein [Clostridia bacterium]
MPDSSVSVQALFIPNRHKTESANDAIEARNLASAFDAVHALKGLTGNLVLTPLTDLLCEITELLRVRKEADYAALISPIRKNYEALKALCTE